MALVRIRKTKDGKTEERVSKKPLTIPRSGIKAGKRLGCGGKKSK